MVLIFQPSLTGSFYRPGMPGNSGLWGFQPVRTVLSVPNVYERSEGLHLVAYGTSNRDAVKKVMKPKKYDLNSITR